VSDVFKAIGGIYSTVLQQHFLSARVLEEKREITIPSRQQIYLYNQFPHHQQQVLLKHTSMWESFAIVCCGKHTQSYPV